MIKRYRIKTLDLGGCDQATITDAAFVHLGGIQSLNMRYCNQVTIKDAAFLHLRGIHNLQLRGPVRCCRCPRLGLVVM